MSTLGRTELTVVDFTLVLTVVCALVGTLVAPALLYVGFIGLFIIWGLSVYWAFSLRHFLSAQLYRKQALGEGLVAIGLASFNAWNLVFYGVQGNIHPSTIESDISLSAIMLSIVLAFYWIDSSVLAARKSDPLYRDVFHWSKVRLVIWAMVVGSVLLFCSLAVVAPSFLIQGSVTTGSPTVLFLVLFFTALICTFGLGLVLLLVSGRRSRDQTLRRNLEWFALLAVSVLVFFVLDSATGNGSPGTLSSFFGGGDSLSMVFISASYCIYRSVKSLAPVNRLAGKDVGTAERSTQ